MVGLFTTASQSCPRAILQRRGKAASHFDTDGSEYTALWKLRCASQECKPPLRRPQRRPLLLQTVDHSET